MPSVSYSETSSFLLCRRKHYYGYTKSLQRITESTSLQLGKAGHSILEAFYARVLEGGDTLAGQKAALAAAYEAAEKKYDEIIAEGFEDDPKKATLREIVFDFYLANEPLVMAGWRILAVEMEFVLDAEVGIDEPLRTVAVVDLIAMDPDGKTVIIDHKFVYDFYTYNDAAIQPQIPLYIGVIRAKGFKVDYGMYNMLRNRKIKAPTIDQRMSTLPIKLSTQRVTRTFTEQIATALDVVALKQLSPEEQDVKAYRVANKMVCQSCSFKDLCTTELAGGNAQLMMQSEYKIRERRVFEQPYEEAEMADA